jgi:hypothetical protein
MSEFPQNDVLNIIYRLDAVGINLNIWQFERFFADIPNIDSIYEKLLFNGDILEMQMNVYPIESINLAREENTIVQEAILQLKGGKDAM